MPKNFENLYSFETYIRKVLGQVHPDARISQATLSTLNNMNHVVADKIIDNMSELMRHKGVQTVSAKIVINAAQLYLPQEIAQYAINSAYRAVNAYNASSSEGSTGKKKKSAETEEKKPRAKPISSAKRSELQFKPSLARNIIRAKIEGKDIRISTTAGVALAAILEEITAGILETSGRKLIEDKKGKTIQPKHLTLAIHDHEELAKMFGRFPGTFPSISARLTEKYGPKHKEKSIAHYDES